MENAENKGQKSLGNVVLIGFFIVISIIVIIGAIIKFNFLGIGSAISPIIEDIPIINVILPTDSASSRNVEYATVEEAVEKLNLAEKLLDDKDDIINDLNKEIDILNEEIKRLSDYESKYQIFEREKYEFEKNVVFNENAPDLEEYIKYYDNISDENKDIIYDLAVAENEYNQKVEHYIEMFESMKPNSSAAIIDELYLDDMTLVIRILEKMEPESVADILSVLEPKVAAEISKELDPNLQ